MVFIAVSAIDSASRMFAVCVILHHGVVSVFQNSHRASSSLLLCTIRSGSESLNFLMSYSILRGPLNGVIWLFSPTLCTYGHM